MRALPLVIALCVAGCGDDNAPSADASASNDSAIGIDAPSNDPDATANASDAPTGADGAAALCCNAADQPGTGNNPICFEGASCCDDGSWQCNNGAGQPTCTTGDVCSKTCCNPADQPGTGNNPICFEGASCCDDGSWQCNNGAGQPTCSSGTGDVCTSNQ